MRLYNIVSTDSIDGDRLKVPKEYRLLFVIMGLPLIDGVFLTIVLTDGLSSLINAVFVGSFIFGGGATIGMILSEFDQDIVTSVKRTIMTSIIIMILAIIQVLIAPLIESAINQSILSIGAFLALTSLSIRILPYKSTDKIIPPTVIIGLFILLSFNPMQVGSVNIIESLDIILIIYTIVSIIIATIISITTILFRSKIKEHIDTRIIKYTTSIGIFIIGLSIVGYIPSIIAPIVLIVGVFGSIF